VLAIKRDWLVDRQQPSSSDSAGCVAMKPTRRPKRQPGPPKRAVADTPLSSPGGNTY
jgi:hypothetical protein